MFNPLIRKLRLAGSLDVDDEVALQAISALGRQVEADRDLSREGDRPETVHLVMDGLAYRYKVLPGGKRQIVAIMVPGDFCDLHVAILGQRDHSIATLASTRIVEISHRTIKELIATRPKLAHAFWWATLVDESILREWLTSLGRRDGEERMAHFFCELLVRFHSVGLASENSYDLPMTQIELSDTLGFSSVHANRVAQSLRKRGLIVLRRGRLEIPDAVALKVFCGFDPSYLHLTPRQPNA